MNRLGSATTTTTVRPNSGEFGKEKSTKTPFGTNELRKQEHFAKTEPPSRTGGWFDKTTLWGQEVYRYHPSPWLLVRLGSLIAYPFVASAIGKYVYPPLYQTFQEQGIDTKILDPLILGFMPAATYCVHNVFYALLYHFQPKALEKYRVDEKPWHWDMEPEQWNERLRTTIGLVLLNVFCLTTIPAYLNTQVIGNLGRIHPSTLPGSLELFWQLPFCMLLEDFGFHHVHRLLHTKQFYWIHKVHHHYSAPIGIAATYAHPIEFVLGDVVPSVLGLFLMKLLGAPMHVWAGGAFVVFRLNAAVESHSGYEFPWSMYQAVPFKTPTEYHDFHHNRNQENFSGVLRIWDCIYGSNQEYFEWVRAGRPETLKSLRFHKEKDKVARKRE